jgi:hypothetical protein
MLTTVYTEIPNSKSALTKYMFQRMKLIIPTGKSPLVLFLVFPIPLCPKIRTHSHTPPINRIRILRLRLPVGVEPLWMV